MADHHRETIASYADLSALQARLGEAAGHDDERIGQGYECLKQKGFYWVVVRVKAQRYRTPGPTPTLVIETWAQPPETAAIERCYVISDDVGILAVARAKWVLVRVADGHPVRLRTIPGLLEARSFSDEDTLPRGYEPILDLTDASVVDLTVNAAGIDQNGHLNNAYFWQIITAGSMQTEFPVAPIGASEIAYVKPLFAGEAIRIFYKKEGFRVEFSGRVWRDQQWILAFAGSYSCD